MDYRSDTDPWKWKSRIGKGSFGIVDAVRSRNGLTGHFSSSSPYYSFQRETEYARKRFEDPTGDIKASAEAQRREHGILVKLSGLPVDARRHMVQLIESYSICKTTEHVRYFLVMTPKASEGSLTKFLHNVIRCEATQLQSQSLLKMMGCLVIGLEVMRRAKIRHHDIHPGNILVHNGSPLYSDFGLSYDFETSKDSKTNENHHCQYQFAAPEYFNKEVRGTASEVFSLGGVLYEIAAVLTRDPGMLNHRPSQSNTRFGNDKESTKARKGLKVALENATHHYQKAWLDIIAKMLNMDSRQRPSAEQVYSFIRGETSQFSTCESCKRWLQKAGWLSKSE